jgi:hypothetical protein
MSSKVVYESESPKTQSIEAVKALMDWRNIVANSLPAEVNLGSTVLVLSQKKDAYYTVTAKGCSCPAATYRPGEPCKHRARLFPDGQPARAALPCSASRSSSGQESPAQAYQRKQRELRALAKASLAEPVDPLPRIGGSFKPFLEEVA